MTARAFVLGGSRGIGRAVSLALAGAGADVAVGYAHREAAARETVEAIERLGRRALSVEGDAGGDPQALVERAADALGGLTAFVACAAEAIPRHITELTDEDWERTLRVNARPFVLGAVAAARRMPEGGSLVAVSSTGTHVIRNRRYAPLALAKGAVEAAVRFLAVELAPAGITVNAVAPGPTGTEAFDAMAADPATLRARLAGLTPMGRLGEPDDAARLIAFLCSPQARWVTGQLIFSDGGYSLV